MEVKCFVWVSRDRLSKTRMIRLWVIEGPNARDQIAFCAVHSFLVEVQTKLATHSRCMQNSNLEIKIAGDNPCPFFLKICIRPRRLSKKVHVRWKWDSCLSWTWKTQFSVGLSIEQSFCVTIPCVVGAVDGLDVELANKSSSSSPSNSPPPFTSDLGLGFVDSDTSFEWLLVRLLDKSC